MRHSSCTSIAGNGDKVPSVILVAWGRFRDTLQKSVFEVHEDLLGSVLRICRRGVDGHIPERTHTKRDIIESADPPIACERHDRNTNALNQNLTHW